MAVRWSTMAKRASICSSSGIPLVEPKSTSFPCPLCGEPIGRSERCRDQGVQYRCPNCSFEGP
ncbi:MAG: zinc finger domain-containing protein [Candidatus Thermoplasmatota archaeon]|nr:zinc finger domain-containing protein [Candidatus Thermoplasmatota archaeon]